MRIVLAALAAASLATSAMADTPAASAGPGPAPADIPPASVWAPVPSGGYEHLLTGLLCPEALGGYHRRAIQVFDGFGLDVGCAYAGADAGVSYFLTRREAPGLDAAMAEARRELEASNAARHPRLASQTRPRQGDIDWTIAVYDDDGGMRDAIWLADLSGWTLEYRATYHAEAEARITGEINAFAADVRAGPGARLATCAKARAARRNGRPVTDRRAIEDAVAMSSILGGAEQSIAAEGKDEALGPPPTLCVERAGAYQGVPMVFWRSIAPDGSDLRLDQATTVSMGPR